VTGKTTDLLGNSKIVADRPSRNLICAIAITFRPDDGLSARLGRAGAHASQIVIVDNGSGAEFTAVLDNAQRSVTALLVSNPDNRGVAAALNQGVEFALKNEFQWALLFDQDSTALPELLRAAQNAYDEFPEPNRIAVIGADHDHPFHFKKRQRFPGDSGYREMKTVITSGSLINLSIYQKLGSFRDDLFIDSVDDEYCMRARDKGFAVIEATSFGIAHEIGKPKIVQLLGKPRSVSNHPPVRRYYMARNRLRLAAEYLFKDTFWALFLLKSMLRELFFITLFEDQKRRKWKAILLGMYDAVAGKFGKLDETRLEFSTTP
jgi:rhamnosyltransferase